MKPELIPAVFCGLLWLLSTVTGTTTSSFTSSYSTNITSTTPTTTTTPSTTTMTSTATAATPGTSSSELCVPSSGSDGSLGRGIGIGIGIMLGVVALAAAAVTYFLWRRQWQLDLANLCHGGNASGKQHGSEEHLEPANSPNGGRKVYNKPPKETPAAQAVAKPTQIEASPRGPERSPGDKHGSRRSNMYEAPNPAYDTQEKYEPLSCQDQDERQSMTYEDPDNTSHYDDHSQSQQQHKIPKGTAEKPARKASLPERRPPDGGAGSEAKDDDEFYVNYDETARNDRVGSGGGDAVEGVRGQGMSAAAATAPVSAVSSAKHAAHPDDVYMPMDGTGHGQQRPPSEVYMNYDAQSRV